MLPAHSATSSNKIIANCTLGLYSIERTGETMKDFLTDIVAHTQALGVINLVKITGDDKSTILESVSDDKSLVINAEFNTPNPAFAGVYGLPNLNKLATILYIPEYRENAQIDVITQNRNGVDTPVGLHFENASKDFKNDYRFMAVEIVNEQLKSVKFKGANWNITFEPTQASIQRLKFQAQANSDESMFQVKTENNNLKFYFGDHSTHAGDFVFQGGITGTLKMGWYWPVAIFQGILNLDGDKTIQLSDDGVAQITVDSGLIKYRYILPAQSK